MTDKEKIILKHISLAEERMRLILMNQSKDNAEWKAINQRINEISQEMKALEDVENDWNKTLNPVNEDIKMLTQEEVAECINVSVSTLTMLREIGIIRAIKTGKCYMFPKDEVKRYQCDYLDYDTSNRVKALEAYKKVTAGTVT